MRKAYWIAVAVVILRLHAWTQPKPSTLASFDQYIARQEILIANEQRSVGSFLPLPQNVDTRAALRRGEVLVEKMNDQRKAPDIDGGLIHHWVGTAFIPNATIGSVLAVVRDVDNFPVYYAPEVAAARNISRSPSGSLLQMRLVKESIITVVLDAEFQVSNGSLDPNHQFSASRSTRIYEVRDPGKPSEMLLPPEKSHGFLWRMNSYWRYVQADGGVYIRCETISLSRDIPFGLSRLIGPIISRMPRESLRSTMKAIRKAVINLPALSEAKEKYQ